MKISSGSHAARAGSVALVGAALLGLPALLGSTAAAQETTADKCAETLKENYGVTDTGNVNQQDGSSRRSVYAEGTTASGETVRFRCLHKGREEPEVQVYAEPEPGSARDWADWGPADEYRVEGEPEAEPDETQSNQNQQSGQPGQPADSDQAAQPEQDAQPDQAEQPEQDAQPDQAEQPAEQAEQESEEAAGPKRARPPEDDAS